jgi:predicted amidophosphoribosyltransferase
MNAIALHEVNFGAAIDAGTATGSSPGAFSAEDLCFGCGKLLAEGEEKNCVGCADLALHNGECRHCGRLLNDVDLANEACTDCTA